jgi:hypothetical protein
LRKKASELSRNINDRGSQLTIEIGSRLHQASQAEYNQSITEINEFVNSSQTQQSQQTQRATKDALISYENMMLQPVTLVQRKRFDPNAVKEARFPPNPMLQHECIPPRKLVSLQDFCRQRSIPFSENEQRFYKIIKQRYLHREFSQALD